MRGGLWSSFSVPGGGYLQEFEPYCDAGQKPVGLIGVGRIRRSRWRCEHAPQKIRPGIVDPATGRKHPRSASVHLPDRCAIAAGAGNRTGDQTAVISPVEAEPRPALPRLVLQVRGLVEMFVVVDAERLNSTGT